MWALYQPRGIRYTHDLLGSVCNRAKLGGCTYDVLVLIIANYDRLQIKTTISMASGVKDIRPIWRTLGSEKAKALPRLIMHLLKRTTLADIFRIGKATWLKLFSAAGVDVFDALGTLCKDE